MVGAGAKYGVSPDLGYAKTLTVCAPATGFASNFLLDQSIDGTRGSQSPRSSLRREWTELYSLPPHGRLPISGAVGTGYYQVS